MSNKTFGVSKGSMVTNRCLLRKKCTDDLKSFNTSVIKYRSEHPNAIKSHPSENIGANGNADKEEVMINTLSYIVQTSPGMPPSMGHHNNNNNLKISHNYNNNNYGHINGKIMSPPHCDEFGDYGRCCNNTYDGNYSSVKVKNGHVANANYAPNSLIGNKFSNSSPSVFYASTTSNGANGNVHNNNNNNGYYKTRYYSSNKPKDIRKRVPYQLSDINKRVFGLMERFQARSYLFYIPSDPAELIHCNQFDMLNQCIWDVYLLKAQKEETYLRKLEFWKYIYLGIQKIMLRYGLFLVGSTMSGLGLDSSDIDMCLLVRPGLTDARADALSHLQNICKLLEHCDFVKSPEVIMAKVPILKFRDAHSGFEVDLNCNNSVGIRNTHLLNAYARMDWRVRPMVVIVKVWAQANDINDAKRMTINSYSLALMTLHYLQSGVSPPAIPCLQALYPERFGPQVEIHSLDQQDELPSFYSSNKQSIGELFLGFLHYFSHFNYNQFAMSVREGALLCKEKCRYVRAPKNDITQWKLLCIEEPFDLTNTARCVYDIGTFEHIKNVFRGSYETLVNTKNLSSILPLVQVQPHLTSPISIKQMNQTNQR